MKIMNFGNYDFLKETDKVQEFLFIFTAWLKECYR